MKEATLYMLRPGHEAIDAVIQQSHNLFMIQLSVRSYEQHRSKSSNLYSDVAARENPNHISILQYYKGLSGCSKAYYIYITLDEYDMKKLLLSNYQLRTAQQREPFGVGTVLSCSDTQVHLNYIKTLL